MGAINWHNVTVTPYEFQDVLIINLTQGINEHARLFLTGVLPDATETESKDYVQETTQNSPITVNYLDGDNTKQTFFKGIVTSIKQRTVGDLDHLDIEAISYSYLLDVIKTSRSFQRNGSPYSYILEQVNSKAREYVPNLTGDVVSAQDYLEEAITQCLVLQYKETDWQFLKRLAAQFNLGLTPDITFDSPKVYFGPVPQKERDDESTEPKFNVSAYQIRRDTADYAVASNNYRKNSGATFSENDFTYCEAESLDMLSLGQTVTFLEKTWYIKNIHTRMEKGTVNNTYTLTTKQGLMQDDLRNQKLIGVSLQGTVKTVTNDQVQVHITEIDDEWDDSSTWYFPYTTVYSSPDGTGWYCMPEVGDSVRIYFSNDMEEAGVAASSINAISTGRGSRSDPDSKILSTVYGKQVILTPGGIQIIANGNLLMTLSDDGGLTINSDKKIVLNADEDISITSQSQLTVSGKSGVNLSQGGGSINITDDIKIGGNKVKIQP